MLTGRCLAWTQWWAGESPQYWPGSGGSKKTWVLLLDPREPAVSLTEARSDWKKLSLLELVFLYASSLPFSSQGISQPVYLCLSIAQNPRELSRNRDSGEWQLRVCFHVQNEGSCMSGYIWCLWLYHKFPQIIIIIYDIMLLMGWKFRWSYPGP